MSTLPLAFLLATCLLVRRDEGITGIDVYRFRSGPTSVRVVETVKLSDQEEYPYTGVVTAEWKRNGSGQFHRQQLPLPPTYWPRRATMYAGLPGVLLWKPSRDAVLLVVLLTNEIGTWNNSRLAVYRLQGSRWLRLASTGEGLRFSNLGSFTLSGRDLYLWDMEYDDRSAHYSDHRYRLSRYQWRSGRLQHIQSRVTRRRYAVFGWAFLPEKTMPDVDPLREFGLNWRWWGRLPEARSRL